MELDDQENQEENTFNIDPKSIHVLSSRTNINSVD